MSGSHHSEDSSGSRPVRGIIFDLDGTLYTISWLRLYIALGLMGDIQRLRMLFPVRAWLRDKQPFKDEGELKRTFASELARRAGGTRDTTLEWYENRFMQRFIQVLGKRGMVREGLVPFLELLRSRNVRLAVVSDFGRVAERLDALRIPTGLFDRIVGAEAYGTMKPTPVPYLDIADRWRLTPGEILLVGDRVDSDAVSANLAGTRFLGVAGGNDGGPDFLPWADLVIQVEALTL